MISADNPYRSPEGPSRAFQRRPGVHVTLVSRKWLYRCFRVEAPVEAIIEYRGRGAGELVAVNGITARYIMPLFWFATRFAFDLETDQQPVPIEVHVRVNYLLRIRGFQLWMDGELAYEEGTL